jgi:hypothetical protein
MEAWGNSMGKREGTEQRIPNIYPQIKTTKSVVGDEGSFGKVQE